MGAKIVKLLIVALCISLVALSAQSSFQDNLDQIEDYLGYEINDSSTIEEPDMANPNGPIEENVTINVPENITLPDNTLDANVSEIPVVNITIDEEILIPSKKNKTKKKGYELIYQNIPVKKIELHGFGVLAVPDIDVEEVSIDDAAQAYAIDPTRITFDNATVTVTAKGTTLFKCKDWNYPLQRCDGDWALFKSGLIPGKNYTFTLTPTDPGFKEINITDAEHLDVNGSLINNIFDEVEDQDGDWSEHIYVDEIVRVTFEGALKDGRFINLYVKSSFKNMSIEVWPWNGSYPVAFLHTENETIIEGMYDIAVGGLRNPATVFDIKIIGGNASHYVEFDYIHDSTVNVSDCRPLNVSGTVYTMNRSIFSAVTCFTVAADNVTLDCQGFNLTGDSTYNAYGVYSNNYDNVTVRNCNFFTFGRAVEFLSTTGTMRINITNLNISLGINNRGLYFDGSSLANRVQATVENVFINGNSLSSTYGIIGDFFPSSTFVNITIVDIYYYGMSAMQCPDLTLKNYYVNNQISTSSAPCIYLSSSPRANLSNITLIDCSYMGIYTQNSADLTLSGFNITDAGGYGINHGTAGASPNSVIENGYITSSGSTGIQIDGASDDCNITNVTITNNGGYGLQISSQADNIRVINNTIKYNTLHDIYNWGPDNIFIGNHLMSGDRIFAWLAATWNNSAQQGNTWELYDDDCEGCYNQSGYCNVSYDIAVDNVDNYPTYTGVCSMTVRNCNNCTQCSNILNNGTFTPGDTLNITANLSTTGDCIVYSGTTGLDGIPIQCNGFNLDGDDTWDDYGIRLNLNGLPAVTNITNCNITDFGRGIFVEVHAEEKHILIDNVNITQLANRIGIYMDGDSHAIYANATISNVNIYGGADGINLNYWCDYSTLSNIFVRDATTSGITAYRDNDHITISNYTSINNGYGIYTWRGNYFDISNFNITGSNTGGIRLSSSPHNYCRIENGRIIDTIGDGFWSQYMRDSNITNVTISNTTGEGLELLSQTDGNKIINNTIKNTTLYNILNTGTNNIFIGNFLTAEEKIFSSQAATWNNSAGGNTWELFDDECEGCGNASGFCNVSYQINSNNIDKKPHYVGKCDLDTFNCNSCASCTALLNNYTFRLGDTLNITGDLPATEHCIWYKGKTWLDSIPVECNGYDLRGDAGAGDYAFYFQLTGVTHTSTISNCNISNFGQGAYVLASNMNKNIVFEGVNATDCRYGLNMQGLSTANLNVTVSNFRSINSISAGINFVGYCDDSTLSDIYMEDVTNGLYMYESDRVSVYNITVVDSSNGVYLWRYNDDFYMRGFNVTGATSDGVILGDSKACIRPVIEDGYISDIGRYGIYVAYPNTYFNITNVTITNVTQHGLYGTGNADNGRIINNTFINITLDDVYMASGAINNLFYGNNFYNASNITIAGGADVNAWNTTKPIGGNMWAAFDEESEGCFDVNGDGFCDNANMTINANNIDYLPLYKRESEFKTAPITYTPSTPSLGQDVTVNATAINVGSFNVTNLNVSFYVDGALRNSTLVNLSLNETQIVQFIWPSILGTHTFKIALDPKSLLPDGNRSNNNATASINVSRIITINVTEPVPREIVRGKRTVALPDEDRQDVVPDDVLVIARVYDPLNLSFNVSNANCSFYLNASFIGSNLSNAQGICQFTINKTIYDPYNYTVMVNFTPPNASYYTNNSINNDNTSFVLITIITNISALNERAIPGIHYSEGDAAVANVTITKDGVLFDPVDIEVRMLRTNGATQNCTLLGACDGYYIKDSTGKYRFIFNVVGGDVNQSLYWYVYPSNGTDYTGSANYPNVTVQNSTGTLNTSLVDKTRSYIPNSSLLMRDSAGYVLVNSTLSLSYFRPVTLLDSYYLFISDNISNSVEFTNLTPVVSADMVTQFVYNQSIPADVFDNTDIIGMQQASNFTNATVRIYKTPGMRSIDKILYCPIWNVTNANCTAAWQVNGTTGYPGFVQTPNYIEFTVYTFSAFAGGAGFNANLTIWDETDRNMPFANKTIYVNQQLQFFANYSNSTNGVPINTSNDYCEISEDSAGIWSFPVNMTYNTTSEIYMYNKSFPVAGTYNFNVSCVSSTYDNLSAVDNFTISSDPIAPVVTLNAPAPGFRTALSTIRFNWSVTDNIAAVLNCNLTIDGAVNATRSVPNGTWVNVTVTGFAKGDHYWNVTCVDGAGNSNISETRKFTTGYRPSGGGGGGGGGAGAATLIIHNEQQPFIGPQKPPREVPFFGGFNLEEPEEQPKKSTPKVPEEKPGEEFSDLPFNLSISDKLWKYKIWILLAMVVLLLGIMLAIQHREVIREKAVNFRYAASRKKISNYNSDLKVMGKKLTKLKKRRK